MTQEIRAFANDNITNPKKTHKLPGAPLANMASAAAKSNLCASDAALKYL